MNNKIDNKNKRTKFVFKSCDKSIPCKTKVLSIQKNIYM